LLACLCMPVYFRGMQIRMLNGLGLTASKPRTILPGHEFDSLFPAPERTDPYLSYNGTNEQTLLQFIPRVVKQYHTDTAKIALYLKREKLADTLRAIWEFVYRHIQYKPDSPFEEQIRRPARTWADRHSGVDCDCYTVFISSILTNLHIPHYIRMTAYSSRKGYQHVYVIVPKHNSANLNKRNEYWALDPVMDAFDAEKPYLYKKDKLMLGFPKNGLNGLPIRALNGEIPYASRSKLAYGRVYYHPGLKTWALKGIDGAYYIRGNPNARFIESYTPGGLGFITTALTALKLGKDLVASLTKKKTAKPAENNEKPVQQTDIVSKLTAVNNNTILSLDKVKADIDTTIKNSNRAAIISLDNLNKGIVKRIDNTFAAIQPQIERINQQAQTTAEMADQISEAINKAIALTAGGQKLTNDIQNTLADEQKRNEAFRADVLSKLRTGQFMFIALSALILLTIFKKQI